MIELIPIQVAIGTIDTALGNDALDRSRCFQPSFHLSCYSLYLSLAHNFSVIAMAPVVTGFYRYTGTLYLNQFSASRS